MGRRFELTTRILVPVVFLGLAVLRLVYHASLADKMDNLFFILVGIALMLLVVPIHQLKSFKAGGIEFSLDQPKVQAAIISLGLNRIQNEGLRVRLSLLQHQLEAIRGSRVLWIDDKPQKILAERRLLRALGVEVVPAISSESAQTILENDNDFDVIVTDIQRPGETYKETGGIRVHEGVNFIVKLRSGPDSAIATLPVVFFANYPWDKLLKFTKPARDTYPSPEITNAAIDFIPKTIKLLAESRSTPIIAADRKGGGPLRPKEPRQVAQTARPE